MVRWDSYDTVNDTSCQDDHHHHDLSSSARSSSQSECCPYSSPLSTFPPLCRNTMKLSNSNSEKGIFFFFLRGIDLNCRLRARTLREQRPSFLFSSCYSFGSRSKEEIQPLVFSWPGPRNVLNRIYDVALENEWFLSGQVARFK